MIFGKSLNFKQLSPSEVEQLSFDIQHIKDAALLFQENRLSLEEKEEIEYNASQARDKLICANLPLVLNFANRFKNNTKNYSDMVCEGIVGLIKSVETYDHKYNVKFSTFAQHNINRCMINFILRDRMVYIPPTILGLMKRWRKREEMFINQHSRTPSIKEMACILKVPIDTANIIHQMISARRIIPQHDADDYNSLNDIKDYKDDAPDSEQNVVDKDYINRLLVKLEKYDHRFPKIVKMRFGLDGYKCMSFSEIGKRFKLTRQRVEQIINESLDKLREYIQEKSYGV